MSDYLTPTEVAAVLGVSRTTAYRWMKRGHLPAFADGHVIRTLRTDLDTFIAERTTKKTA